MRKKMSNFINPEKIILQKDRILVKVPPADPRYGSIILSDDRVEAEQSAASKGILVKAGKNAFDDFEEKPEIGDTICFSAFSGLKFYDESEQDQKVVAQTIYRNLLGEDVIGFEKK